jgi:hypothetical protein
MIICVAGCAAEWGLGYSNFLMMLLEYLMGTVSNNFVAI